MCLRPSGKLTVFKDSGYMMSNLVAQVIRNAIRANRFARITRNSNPYFYRASSRFARITRISDSRKSPDSRKSCESISMNHATKMSNMLLEVNGFEWMVTDALA